MPFDSPDKPTDETGMEPRGQRATERIIPGCVTAVCADGNHDLCSTRLCVNPSDGWHNARYVPCPCRCHRA